jgi:hypothetical protein
MLKRLLLVLAAVLFAPLCVELALRASYDPERAAEEIRTQRGAVVAAIPGLEQEETRKGRIPHPYIGWTERNRFQQIARELATFTGGRADETLEVLVVGGSVSGLVGANGAEGIRAGLQADQRFAGRDVVVLNHGHGSFKQPQQVMLVAYLLGLGYRPDVILNVDGFNEVALGMDNVMRDANPLYPHWPQYAPTAGAAVRAPEVEAALTDLAIAQAALDRAAREALESSPRAAARCRTRCSPAWSRRRGSIPRPGRRSGIATTGSPRSKRSSPAGSRRRDRSTRWRACTASRTCTCCSRRCTTRARSR